METAFAPRQREGEYPADNDTRAPPRNPELRILHHTPGRYLVVSKPADVRMDGDFEHTVEKLALRHLKLVDDVNINGFAPRFVQRLDYATSGVLLIALSRIAAGVAATQFEQREVRKEYVALVHGHVDRPSDGGLIVIDAPIADGLPRGSYHMEIGSEGNNGRPSRTVCTPMQHGQYFGAPVTKVRLQPESGRRHQLRVHLAHRGWPIVGDATYASLQDYRAFPGMIPPRMMLHAKSLHVRLAIEQLYGRKSGLKTARPFVFDAGDPLEGMEGLTLWDIVDKGGETCDLNQS